MSSQEIPIRIYLNQDLDATKDFDTSKDICVDIEKFQRDGDLNDLIDDLKAFFNRKQDIDQQKKKEIKHRFRDKSYKIVFKTEDNCQIDDDDDLAQEIQIVFPESDSENSSDTDNDDDNNNTNKKKIKMVNLRIIFEKQNKNENTNENKNNQMEKPIIDNDIKMEIKEEKKEDIKEQNIAQPPHRLQLLPHLNPPRLRTKRIGRYYDSNQSKMAYYAILRWNAPNTNQSQQNMLYVYDIRETTASANHLCPTQIKELTCPIQPLDVNTEYQFQIKVYNYNNNNNNISSEWSESYTIHTPTTPKLLPVCTHLQIVTLLPNALFIRFDPGFVAKPTDQIRYWYKETNHNQHAPFGVVHHPTPFGGFGDAYPLHPNAEYKLMVYTENLSTGGESLPSEPLYFKTPLRNFIQFKYKPQPPTNIIAQYETECKQPDEIIIFWKLPPNTYGNIITYEVKIGRAANANQIKELPLRVPISMLSDTAVVEIVTVSAISDINNNNNVEYKSEPGFYYLLMNENDNNNHNIRIEVQLPQLQLADDMKDVDTTTYTEEKETVISVTPGNRSPVAVPIFEKHQTFKWNIKYIHNTIDESIPMIFNMDIDFMTFQRQIITQCNIPQHNANLLSFKIDDGQNNTFLNEITFDGYKNMKQEHIIKVGFVPTEPPDIYDIVQTNNKILCKWAPSTAIKFMYQYEVKHKKNKDSICRKTPHNQMIISNIDYNGGDYNVRICALNEFGKSRWGAWTSITPIKRVVIENKNYDTIDEKNKLDDHSPVAELWKQPSNEFIYIWLFVDKIKEEGYWVEVMGLSEVDFIRLECIDRDKKIYYCKVSYPNRDMKLTVPFKIYTYAGMYQKDIAPKHEVFPKMAKVSNELNIEKFGWLIGENDNTEIVDIKNYGAGILKTVMGNTESMPDYYERIYRWIVKYLMQNVNKKFPCCFVINMIRKLRYFLRARIRDNQRTQYMTKCILYEIDDIIPKYHQIKNWNQCSKWFIKIALELLFQIKNFPQDIKLKGFYTFIMNKYEFIKSMDELVLNIGHILQSNYLNKVQKKLYDKIKIASEQPHKGIAQCRFVVWFNLFGCAHLRDDNNPNTTKLGNELLNAIIKYHIIEFDELIILTKLDRKLLQLSNKKIHRPVPMEHILFKTI